MEWADKVRARLNDITTQEAMRAAVRTVLPMMQERIFERGMDKNEKAISEYSKEAIYISLSRMRNTAPGQRTRGGKSKKFPEGYAQYKSELGSKGFDLRNMGVMMRDFLTPIEIAEGNRLRITFKEERNLIISDKYPQAFGMSAAERAEFNRIFTEEFTRRLLR